MKFEHVTEAPQMAEELLEKVLIRLGLTGPIEPTLEGLGIVYAAWCRNVPFDNIRKIIHLREGNSGPFPGSTPGDFWESWLRFGTGATCWGGAGALHALLSALGFRALRGVATMLAAPDLPPNHGTVAVEIGRDRYLVDASMLHGEPLPLRTDGETRIRHSARGLSCSVRDGRWHISWRPLHKPEGFECRLERFGATGPEFHEFHQKTRGWSPFNYEVYARANRGDRVVGLAFGKAVRFDSDGSVDQHPTSDADRRRILIEEIGISEELVERLPEDLPTPPPPGSRKAQLQAVSA